MGEIKGGGEKGGRVSLWFTVSKTTMYSHTDEQIKKEVRERCYFINTKLQRNTIKYLLTTFTTTKSLADPATLVTVILYVPSSSSSTGCIFSRTSSAVYVKLYLLLDTGPITTGVDSRPAVKVHTTSSGVISGCASEMVNVRMTVPSRTAKNSLLM